MIRRIPSKESAQADVSNAAEPYVNWWERLSFSTMRRLLRMHLALWGDRGLYQSSRFFGLLEYLVNFKRRRRVGRMLDTVYGEAVDQKTRRRLIREHFMRQRCDKVFYLVFDSFSTEQVKSRLRIVNRQLLDEGLARGRGVYSLLCHHGPHHITGLFMSVLGYRVGGVRDPNEGAIRRYVQQMWERNHPEFPRAKVLYSGNFARDIYRLLKENYGLGSALDVSRVREPNQRTCTVRIFGEEREFLTGTLLIALRCQSTILQSFIVAEENFHYRLELLGPMLDPETADESPETIQRVMQAYADNIETYARRYPDHVTRV